MNEKIKELAINAGYKHLPTVRLAFSGFDTEKFAEMIIMECASVCEEYADRLIGNTEKGAESKSTAYMLADLIKERFELNNE